MTQYILVGTSSYSATLNIGPFVNKEAAFAYMAKHSFLHYSVEPVMPPVTSEYDFSIVGSLFDPSHITFVKNVRTHYNCTLSEALSMANTYRDSQ